MESRLFSASEESFIKIKVIAMFKWMQNLLRPKASKLAMSTVEPQQNAENSDPRIVPSFTAVECAEVYKTYYAWLLQATGDFSQSPTPRAKALFETLEDRLTKVSAAELGLPRRPSMLPNLMASMRSKSSNSEQLVKLIGSDTAFPVKVLSMANSPYYRVTEEPITDIRQALLYLGQNGLKRLVSTALMEPILTLKSQHSKALSTKLYGHIILCADIGAWLAAKSEVTPHTLHLLGLLQGTGSVVLLSFFDIHAGKLPLTAQEKSWVLTKLFIGHARRLAWIVAEHWELGTEIEAALKYLSDFGSSDDIGDLSRTLMSAVLASFAVLLNDDQAVDRAQVSAWLDRAGVSPEVLNRNLNTSASC